MEVDNLPCVSLLRSLHLLYIQMPESRIGCFVYVHMVFSVYVFKVLNADGVFTKFCSIVSYTISLCKVSNYFC